MATQSNQNLAQDFVSNLADKASSKKSQISTSISICDRLSTSLQAALFSTAIAIFSPGYLSTPNSASAQIVTDGSTATQVVGNQVLPTSAGSLQGGNLYHSFNQFNVPLSGTVFGTGNSGINGAAVSNIINRVTGGNASEILGKIQSRAAFPNANLFLLNPNGIIFGNDARLDIGGSFHASTATGLMFENGDTFGIGTNTLPLGNPAELLFGAVNPAGILNQGKLEVRQGRNITLTAGTILSPGSLDAPNGTVGIASVSGGSKVELRSPDAILGLRVEPNAVPTDWQGKITQLPQLARQLTGANPNSVNEATQVVVNPDGSIALAAASTEFYTIRNNAGKFESIGAYTVSNGDASIKTINAGTIQVQAASNLVLLTPQLSTTGNLSLAAGRTVLYRDSPVSPANIMVAGNISLQGNRGIDLQALNFANGAIKSSGLINLISNGVIYTDVTFSNFSNSANATPAGISFAAPTSSISVIPNNVFITNLNGEPAFSSRR